MSVRKLPNIEKSVISSGAKRSREIYKLIKFRKLIRFLPSVEMTFINTDFPDKY